MPAEANILEGGFAEPVLDAQATFRAVMDAMARPASIVEVAPRSAPPAPLSPLVGAIACTLIDADTPMWLDPRLSESEAVRAWLGFHTGARLAAAPAEAVFALIADPGEMPPLDRFAQGTQEYPDRSATLILQLDSLEGGAPLTFRGPGIKGEATIAPADLPADFARQWIENTKRFPRGLDLILTAGEALACLPRSARLMYVAVKGGEAAIDNAHRLLADRRRGDRSVPALSLDQIAEQLALSVDRVMSEGSLYDRRLAALAIKQARGDLIEAIFLVRAYRTTLPRFGHSEPLDTGAMLIERRISACFKDLPGGQLLGPTFDYTHRLLDEEMDGDPMVEPGAFRDDAAEPATRIADILGGEGLIEEDPLTEGEPGDINQTPIEFPLSRAMRLQSLSRGDEGFLLALGYSTQRGYARSHPFVGEIRIGEVDVEVFVPELGFAVPVGRVQLTECQMVNQFKGSTTTPPQFTRGYGLVFGQSERKAMAMSLCDRALRAEELGEDIVAPPQDQEFVISHCDNVQATGFVEHLKLPHYVDFQAELGLVRTMRAEYEAARGEDTVEIREAAE
jgi:alpha-D-ribose 1-methylphosphonate 5-triphosphate synthase subunit PhnI